MGKRLGLGLVAVVAIVAAAYFGLNAYASKQAAKRVDAVLAGLGPRLRATYATVDYDLLTRETAVRGVSLSVAGLPSIPVREVLVRRLDESTPNPAFADLELRGIVLDPATVGEAETLAALGYAGPVLCDWGIRYAYSRERHELDLQRLSVTVKDAGSLAISLRLGNLDLPVDERQAQRFLLTDLARVVLVDAAVTYTDDSLMERALRRDAKEQGIGVEQLKDGLQRQAQAILALPDGKSPQVTGAVAAVKRFIAKPERLSITVKPAVPTPLDQLRTLTSPDAAAKLLNVQVTS